MSSKLARFRFAARLAMLLVLAHAGWPLLAQAAPRGDALTLICTAQGMRVLPAGPDAPAPHSPVADQQQHCALCSPGGDLPGMVQASLRIKIDKLALAATAEPAAVLLASAGGLLPLTRAPPAFA